MNLHGFVSTQLCTTAAGQAVGTAGKPIRVYGVHIISGGTAGVIKLHNGIATTATTYIQETCTAVSTGNTIMYSDRGVLFPNGCFYEEVVDGNVTSTLISFEKEA